MSLNRTWEKRPKHGKTHFTRRLYKILYYTSINDCKGK